MPTCDTPMLAICCERTVGPCGVPLSGTDAEKSVLLTCPTRDTIRTLCRQHGPSLLGLCNRTEVRTRNTTEASRASVDSSLVDQTSSNVAPAVPLSGRSEPCWARHAGCELSRCEGQRTMSQGIQRSSTHAARSRRSRCDLRHGYLLRPSERGS